MLKRIVRMVTALLLVILLVFVPVILSSFHKSGETISFQTVDSGETDQITAYPTYGTSQDFVSEMKKVAENSKYGLYIHPRLAAIALYDKTTQQYYFSNPYNVESDQGGSNEIKNNQRSQILLTYYSDDNTQVTLNSFSDCVAKHQFVINSVTDGVEVQMTLGQLSDQYILPEMISSQLFTELLQNLDTKEQETVKSAYKLYTVSGISEDLANDLLDKYPYLKQDDMYQLSSLSKKAKKTISALFEKAGLTKERIQVEYTKIGYESDDHLPSFTLTVQYLLEDDGLKTAVSMDDVSYQSAYYQVDSLSILPYFGCGQIADTTGELLMPDGSGAILQYNSTYSKRLTSLTKRVYGEDAAEDSDHSDFSTSQDVRLPVFGNKSSQGSYLAVIEEGESICSITASSGDTSDHYPTAYTTAKYRYNELFYYSDKDFSKNMMAYAAYHNAGTVSVKYIPLKTGANYVDMAFAYKNYLVEHDVFTTTHTGSRFIMQLLGYVNNDDGDSALTTYDDAAKIVQELSDSHVNNLALRYIGWTKGGLSNQYINEVSHASLLGGAKSWNALSGLAASQNVDMYMDMDLAYVQRTALFDDFSANLDCCRTVRNRLCGCYVYNYGDSRIDDTQLAYGVSANKLQSDVEKLFKSFQSNIKNAYISAGTLGTALNSTFKSGAVLTRPQAQRLQAESLAKLSSVSKLMLENANAYTLPYCQSVINLSVTSSGYASTDYDVPFYQLVLNGYVEYSAPPFNESENETDNFLKAIETGASISYIVAYRNQNELKSSTQSQYYSVNYGVLKEDIVATYAEFEKVAQSIGDATIAGHQRLADKVFQTTYSNGTVVIVNYGDTAYTTAAMAVPAKGYLCTEGEHTP